MSLNKAVILAGGKATRLKPISLYSNKHLLPIYNKPMIYYSISFLIDLKIKNILIICNKTDLLLFKKLEKEFLKINFTFKIQTKPKGIADGLRICKKFVNDERFIFLLGDNLLHFNKKNIGNFIKMISDTSFNSVLFTSKVKKPNQFGIISKVKNKNLIIEKPKRPQNNRAVIGLYIYDKNCFNYLKRIKKSNRGELEITDINNLYILNNKVNIINLNKLMVRWFDIGSFDSLFKASVFMKNKSV